ncbi:MAG: DOMON-like domain-containing protein [Candidatus Binatia bacterium]
MKSFVPHNVVLACHPDTPSQWVRGIAVRVCQTNGGLITLSYFLDGDLARICIPEPRSARRAGALWEHTCFEAFIALKGATEYGEFNFAPSGEWAAYAFGDYRNGGPIAQDLNPRIVVRSASNRLELDAIISLDSLPALKTGARPRLALCAVVEEEGGALSYWALRHAAGRPDFHHPDAFALELDPPDMDAVSNPAYTGKP